MPKTLSGFTGVATPQGQKAKAGQVKNNAGGYVFSVTPEKQLLRFLILGTDQPTYYQTARALTMDNARVVQAMMEDAHLGTQAVQQTVAVSQDGRAPKNDQALFVLAMAAVSPHLVVREMAYKALPKVARTATHLFMYLTFVSNLKGTKAGMGLRKALQRWYLEQPPEKLAYQLVKYRQREGWTHRDVLRLAKPVPTTEKQLQLFKFATGKPRQNTAFFPAIEGYLQLNGEEKLEPAAAARIIAEYNLPWETVPDYLKSAPEVWAALLPNMPATALIRQLPTLTRVGLLKGDSMAVGYVVGRLSDPEFLRKGRIHPFNVLVAFRTYAQGASMMGSTTWTPHKKIVSALDEAFYLAFGAVEPSGKRIKLALDVSGSMGQQHLHSGQSGKYGAVLSPLTAREASAAMVLVTLAVEENASVSVFSGKLGSGYISGGSRMQGWMNEFPISPDMRLDQVIKKVTGLPFGRTDCALPITSALEAKEDYDAFVIYTDNETWAGPVHPFEALKKYRTQRVKDARLVSVAMTATNYSVADPSDPGMLDVVGFDSSAPELISSFVQGMF